MVFEGILFTYNFGVNQSTLLRSRHQLNPDNPDRLHNGMVRTAEHSITSWGYKKLYWEIWSNSFWLSSSSGTWEIFEIDKGSWTFQRCDFKAFSVSWTPEYSKPKLTFTGLPKLWQSKLPMTLVSFQFWLIQKRLFLARCWLLRAVHAYF